MRLKIFLVLLLCALQQAYGSKSTKKKGESRLKKWAKNSLIAFAVNYGSNEVDDAGKSQVADFNSLGCKYNVPDQNARVMMKFVKCARDQNFEKYMFDNSENCPKINELYKQTESDGNCALNTPKIISDGALAKFRGKEFSTTNMEMLEAYLSSYPGKDYVLLGSGKSLSEFLHMHKQYLFPTKDIDFFQFTSMLELTKLAYPDMEDTQWAVLMALSESTDTNADNAKKLLELTKLAFPNNTYWAVDMALQSEYKDANVDNAKRVLELTKLAYPDMKLAVSEALKPKYKNFNVDKVNEKYQELKKSWLWYLRGKQNIMKEALEVTYPEDVKEDF